jgi:AraC-like DNA-binding protein
MIHGDAERFFITLPELGLPYVCEVEYNTWRQGGFHSHGELQILAIIKGGFGLSFETQSYDLKAGGVCVLPARLMHSVSIIRQRPHCVFLDFRVDHTPASPLQAITNLYSGQQVFSTDADALRGVADELRSASQLGGAEKAATTMSLFWKMFALFSTDLSPRVEKPEDANLDRRLLIADGYLKDRLSSNIGVESVAAFAGLSRSQLTRLYMQHFKVGPAERLRQIRVERAQHLLKTSTLAIKEIAHACGFACPNHFCRTFREATGKAPSRCR